MKSSPWTLEEALKLVRLLEPRLAQARFHVALMGSVLLQGESTNDLDLILFPHSTSYVNLDLVRTELTHGGLLPVFSRGKVAAMWERRGSTDTKHVEVWTYKGKRVDLFFLR